MFIAVGVPRRPVHLHLPVIEISCVGTVREKCVTIYLMFVHSARNICHNEQDYTHTLISLSPRNGKVWRQTKWQECHRIPLREPNRTAEQRISRGRCSAVLAREGHATGKVSHTWYGGGGPRGRPSAVPSATRLASRASSASSLSLCRLTHSQVLPMSVP